MSTVRDLAAHYAGRYRWESTPDRDGDTVAASNVSAGQIVITTGNPKAFGSAILTRDEAQDLALALLYLIDGERPHPEQHDAQETR